MLLIEHKNRETLMQSLHSSQFATLIQDASLAAKFLPFGLCVAILWCYPNISSPNVRLTLINSCQYINTGMQLQAGIV